MSTLQITALVAGSFVAGVVLAFLFHSFIAAKLIAWRDAVLAKLGLKVKE